jgi:hypothetical protein
VEDALPRKLLDLASIRVLDTREAANIKWLKAMRRVWWHTERDDLVVLAVLVKFWRCMAAMAVKNKQAVDSSYAGCCMSVEVLKPLKAKLIRRPAVVAHS